MIKNFRFTILLVVLLLGGVLAKPSRFIGIFAPAKKGEVQKEAALTPEPRTTFHETVANIKADLASQNLLPAFNVQSDMTTSEGWAIVDGGSLDPFTSRSGGGSIKLPYATACPPAPLDVRGDCGVGGSRAYSVVPIAVAAGKTYSFGGYMLTDSEPRGVVDIYVKAFRGQNINADQFGNSVTNKWERFGLNLVIPEGVSTIELHVNRYVANSGPTVSNMWFDDLVLSEGVADPASPISKRAFTGSQTAMDSLGNIRIRMNDHKMHDFFPVCIAANLTRHSDLRFYSNQGFNCEWTRSSPSELVSLRAATHPVFAPEGMYGAIEINSSIRGVFAYDSDGRPTHTWSEYLLGGLEAKIRTITASGMQNRILWYTWDAENVTDKLLRAETVSSAVRRVDAEGNAGIPRHPIAVLNGNPGLARWLRDSQGRPLADISWTYTPGGNTGGAGGTFGGHNTLENTESQVMPGNICQLNTGIDIEFRPAVYRCIAEGAKGLNFWADAGAPGAAPVETEAWWNDFPILRREIIAMMPLIKQPHWTAWKANVSIPDPIVFVGTRDLNGEGYLIVSNRSKAPKQVTINLQGFSYQPASLIDYFSNVEVGKFVGNQATFSLTPEGSATSVGTRGGTAVFKISTSRVAKRTGKSQSASAQALSSEFVHGR